MQLNLTSLRAVKHRPTCIPWLGCFRSPHLSLLDLVASILQSEPRNRYPIPLEEMAPPSTLDMFPTRQDAQEWVLMREN